MASTLQIPIENSGFIEYAARLHWAKIWLEDIPLRKQMLASWLPWSCTSDHSQTRTIKLLLGLPATFPQYQEQNIYLWQWGTQLLSNHQPSSYIAGIAGTLPLSLQQNVHSWQWGNNCYHDSKKVLNSWDPAYPWYCCFQKSVLRGAVKKLVRLGGGGSGSPKFVVFFGNHFLYQKHPQVPWIIWYYHLKWREMLYLTISWCYYSKKTPWIREVLGLTAGGPES